jgi:alpha-1,2-mannosyltransferase
MQQATGPTEERVVGWERIVALGIATLFILCGLAAVALAFAHGITSDFVSFWAAGRLAISGDPAAAYDIGRHRAIEQQVFAHLGFLPFPYPPSFLLLVAPFGLLPFWVALGAWVAITATLYVLAARRWIQPRFALAQAAAAANFITGQNGFLTSAIFICGAGLLATRPLIGGAILGLLSFKPQLAILLPVALLAGREWRAIAGALLSSSALVAASLLIFGTDTYRGFFGILPQYTHWLSDSRWPWGELASPFALLRYLGLAQSAALAGHSVIAIAAAAAAARAWALKLDERIPILAAATLLVPPYLFTYDGLLLAPVLGGLLRREQNHAAFLLVWLFSLLPVVCYFTPFPNTLPLAALVALWALHRKHPAAASQLTSPHQV